MLSKIFQQLIIFIINFWNDFRRMTFHIKQEYNSKENHINFDLNDEITFITYYH